MTTHSPTDEKWFVVAESPRGSRRTAELEPGKSLFVGTSHNCGLQLDGDDVCSLQCLITLENQVASVQDWASKSGTFVNGESVTMKTELSLDDEIRIGDYRLRVRPASAVAAAPPPEPESLRPDISQPDQIPSPAKSELTSADQAAETSGAATGTVDAESIDQVLTSARQAIDRSARVGNAELAPSSVTDSIADAPTDDHPEPSIQTQVATIEPHDGEEPLLDEATSSLNSGGCSRDPFAFDDDLFDAETFDAETVSLLRAEIEDLQAALAQRDEQLAALQASSDEPRTEAAGGSEFDNQSEALLQRLQDLLDEAECHDERVALLEELLHTAEMANQAEQEERAQLEAWVGSIERRIGEREEEWRAETDSLRKQVDQALAERDRVQHQLRDAASQGSAPAAYQETLERLQEQNKTLQQTLEEARRENVSLQQRLAQAENQDEELLREERAAIARERAEVSRLRHELQQKVSDLQTMPKAKEQPDREFADRLKTLREHLKEIHEEEKQERAQQNESSLSGRISRLWKRLEH